MSDKDGGPAFPSAYEFTGGEYVSETGMTLRDYFAAKALQGFCASPQTNAAWLSDHAATSAYSVADAMLKERARDR